MKIIHTSDWHIGKILCDYSLLDDQRYFLDHFIEDMKLISPNVILITGDIYDRSVPTSGAVALLNYVLNRMTTQLNAKIMFISGNHDSKERLEFGSTLFEHSGVYFAGKPTRNIKKITLQDEYGNVNFYLLPYVDLYDVKSLFSDSLGDKKLKNADDAFMTLCRSMLDNLNCKERNILLCHGFFANISNGVENRDLESYTDKQVGGSDLISLSAFHDFDYIAAGHIHSPKKICDNARYSGSPLKYSADEATQKKFYFELNLGAKDSLSITEHAITPIHDLRVIKGKFSDILENARTDDNGSDDYVAMELTDSIPVADVVLRLKSVFPNVLDVRYKSLERDSTIGTAQSISQIEQKSVSQLFSEFYEASTGIPLSDEQSTIAQNIIKALERKEAEKCS